MKDEMNKEKDGTPLPFSFLFCHIPPRTTIYHVGQTKKPPINRLNHTSICELSCRAISLMTYQ
jgi:hypothetical protein